MNTIKKIKKLRWVSSLAAAAALVGTAGLCQAANILIDFNGGMPASFYDGANPAGDEAFTLVPGGGPGGAQCLEATFGADATTAEVDPAFNVSFNTSGYLQVEFDMMVLPGSATTGNLGSGGYGNLQVSLRDSSYSWNGLWYGAVMPPAANNWVHYTFLIPHSDLNLNIAHVQIQLQGAQGALGYANGTLPGGPTEVAVYLNNVQITQLPNPYVFTAFTNTLQGITPDAADDAPFFNPVNGSGPTSLTPAGSWGISIVNPGGYNGWNQYGGSPGLTLDFTRYQYVGFDVFVDSAVSSSPDTGTLYGGTQMKLFNSDWSVGATAGAINFDASMVGKWTHFDFPSAATGNANCPAFVFQGSPGSDGGTNTTVTFHVDNIVFWNPEVIPSITSITRGTPGGVQISVDANGTANLNDQEGFVSPATNNLAGNFFWIGQTPATYSFSLTNFPPLATAPSFDAHIYVVNGSSIDYENSINPGQVAGFQYYNQTYSGVNWNAGDMIALDVQNNTNGGVGVIANFSWKTNLFNGNPSNQWVTTFAFPGMASANGTWTLNFTDNTHGNVTAPDGSVNNFTVPDFSSDPNYTANFGPTESAVYFGVFKNGNAVNNSQGITIDNVTVANAAGVIYNDSFNGPGLAANNAWQVTEYYQFAAARAIWIPYGTAWWLKWNTTASGWNVQSAPDLATWGSAGVAYTYTDNTGTNTLGAVPAAGLPNIDFFRLTK